MRVGIRLKLFWGLLILCNNFYFDLISGMFFYFLGPYWAIFWVWYGVQNLFWVHSCSWTTFIFYASLNSDIWIWLNTWVIAFFLGPYWADFGVRVGFYNCFGANHIVEQLEFSMFPSILTFDFDLIWGDFQRFGVLVGYFWGSIRVQKLFWGLLM